MRSSAIFIAAWLLSACASPYQVLYDQTNDYLWPRPVPPEQVAVYLSPYDVPFAWIELGRFRGGAPTLVEAMALAQRACGRAGADTFILRKDPRPLGQTWTVEGHCAANAEAPPTSPPSPHPLAVRAPSAGT